MPPAAFTECCRRSLRVKFGKEKGMKRTMMRIKEHPILGHLNETETVTIYFEGQAITALKDEPIASALINAGVKVFRKTHKANQPRSVFCGIGRCTDCVMIVNGTPNIRTCVTKVEEGMRIERQIGLGKWSEDL